jgi:orotate phosphoribosyltransferase
MTDKENLIQAIKESCAYKTGDFTLSSGLKSNYYIDLRPLLLSTKYIHYITTCLTQKLTSIGLEKGDLLCGVISSGLFLSGVIMQRLSTCEVELGAIYCRTEHRTHGSKRDIEGQYKRGQNVIILDDVSTTGKSIKKVIDILEVHNLRVKAIVTIVDRNEGARENLPINRFHPIISIEEIQDAS